MPRAWSTVTPDHALVPPAVFHASGDQVSYPNSPGCGIVWNVQRIFPVFTSYARMSPGALGRASGTAVPMMSMSL